MIKKVLRDKSTKQFTTPHHPLSFALIALYLARHSLAPFPDTSSAILDQRSEGGRELGKERRPVSSCCCCSEDHSSDERDDESVVFRLSFLTENSFTAPCAVFIHSSGVKGALWPSFTSFMKFATASHRCPVPAGKRDTALARAESVGLSHTLSDDNEDGDEEEEEEEEEEEVKDEDTSVEDVVSTWLGGMTE